jgi:predicted nucleic acid-binding protein
VGQLALPAAGIIGVDTSALIYHVEQIEPYFSASAPLWQALIAGARNVIASEIALLEALVKPLRVGNAVLADAYRNILLRTVGLASIPISRPVLESAAEIRALHALRTPDAIHAATAHVSGCSLFVTNDPTFRRVPGLNVAVLSEVAAAP